MAKKAIKRLVRGDNGQVRAILIDLETLLPVTDPTGYTIVSAGASSATPEPVADVRNPETPSRVQSTGEEPPKQRYGGGGGALNGRRPAPKMSFPPAPTVPQSTKPTSLGAVERKPLLDVEIVDHTGKPITDPAERKEVISTYARNNPETAATDLLGDRLIGGAATRGVASSVSEMEPELRTGLTKMIEAAPPEIGAGLQIHSGSRTPEQQAALFTASNGSGMVAPPGSSKHEVGVAADLSWNGQNLGNAPPEVQNWVHENAPRFGLSFPMNNPQAHPYEPWHVETISARTGQPWTPPEASVPTPAERLPAPDPARFGGSSFVSADKEFDRPAPEMASSNVPDPARFGRTAMGPANPDFPARPGLISNNTFPSRPTAEFPARPGTIASNTSEPQTTSEFPSRPSFVAPNTEKTTAQNVIATARTPSTNTARGIPAPERPDARAFADAPPAYFAAHGLVDRTPEQITQIARTLSGELSGEQLRALSAGDPIAQRELAHMMTTIENRAQSKMYGSLEKALTPSQYNSLAKENLPTTDENYKLHGGAIEQFATGYYRGEYNDLVDNWSASSYYNDDIVSPGWGNKMSFVSTVGDHTFGSLPEYGPSQDFRDSRSSFATYGDRAGQGTFGTSSSPGVGRSSYDIPTAYADRDGRGSFGTSSSPGVGRSSLGVSGGSGSGPSGSGALGGSRPSGGTSAHSIERERDTSLASRSTTTSRSSAPSAGGRTSSPTNDGNGTSKTPGGGF